MEYYSFLFHKLAYYSGKFALKLLNSRCLSVAERWLCDNTIHLQGKISTSQCAIEQGIDLCF